MYDMDRQLERFDIVPHSWIIMSLELIVTN